LYDRTHSRALNDFGGVATVMPRYAGLFGLAFMASLGLPGLSGFIGEVLVLIGAFTIWKGLVGLAALSLVVTAGYHLWAIQRVQLGPFNEKWRGALSGQDLDGRELATLVPLAAIVLLLGVWPAPVLGTIDASVRAFIDAMAVAGRLAGP
jgi:NADH-quinone oxidoreductase subunit M